MRVYIDVHSLSPGKSMQLNTEEYECRLRLQSARSTSHLAGIIGLISKMQVKL
jgi:hypothetical protein